MLTTVAWQLAGQRAYALEGSVFVAGSLIQWLRDALGLIGAAAESETLARSVPDNGGVYLVPALADPKDLFGELAGRLAARERIKVAR